MGNTINTISYSLFIFERNTISLKNRPCSFSIYFEILRVYSHRGKILSLRIVGYARIYINIYSYITVWKSCEKVGEREKEGCSLLRSTRIVIFQTWRIPPESCPTIAPQSVANILEDLPRARIRKSPPFRLKLGSSWRHSSNVINHTADFWIASRRSRNFPILIVFILKIGWYIFFFLIYHICVEEIVIILLQIEFLYVSLTLQSLSSLLTNA